MLTKNIVKISYNNKHDIDKRFMLKKIREILANLGEKKPIIGYREKNGVITVYLEHDEKNLEHYINGDFKFYYYNMIEDILIPDII